MKYLLLFYGLEHGFQVLFYSLFKIIFLYNIILALCLLAVVSATHINNHVTLSSKQNNRPW